jgi:hypothetical protein
MSQTRVCDVLNLGAGLQSSRVLLGMCRGELPKPDAAVFADTLWEPKAVYANLEFLEAECVKAGIPLVRTGTGASIRAEILEFMRSRKRAGRKRNASAPLFIKNRDGSQGRLKRQCTKEYKIEVIEKWIRRVLLGLKPRQRMPKDVLVRQWFGISSDEGSRAAFPGVWSKAKVRVGTGLFGEPVLRESKAWKPAAWRHNVYPLLNEVWLPTRKIVHEAFLPVREQRVDCAEWLARNYPGRHFPRSACIGCPFRSNIEWREMRDERPDEWADACDFDDQQRQPDAAGAAEKNILVGEPFLHRQMVPLRMADLDAGVGESGGGLRDALRRTRRTL